MSIINTDAKRDITLGAKMASIPERLLLAHSRGEVLFIAGAGVSQPAGLPDFRELTVKVYAKLDAAVHKIIDSIPRKVCDYEDVDTIGVTDQQAAEVRRFINGDYDVVLGMLERRIDGQSSGSSKVRKEISRELRSSKVSKSPIHQTLMQLADRGGSLTIVTTNFDLLLENAAKSIGSPVETYALGGIPRPGRNDDFSGVLHIHGAFDRNPSRYADLIVSDQDFGEFYLRRRIVPDFIYDAARLYNLVLVGYSANDPPMRYLLNAVAADGSRFDDLKERFAFVGNSTPDPISLEDWRGRGITPIHYDSVSSHSVLRKTLKKWADLSAINGDQLIIDNTIKRIVKKTRVEASEGDRDLFDHLIRRSGSNERRRLTAMASEQKADIGWLDSILTIGEESIRERR